MNGIVYNIQRYSVHDGPGIRTVVFLKGCPLRCRWCSNPESQEFYPELAFQSAKCIGLASCGVCLAIDGIAAGDGDRPRVLRKGNHSPVEAPERCPAGALQVYGERMSVEKVISCVENDSAFYVRSGGGITLSGGEPLAQPEFALEILRRAKSRHIHTAIETSGSVPWEVLSDVCRYLDFVMYDVKCADSEKHCLYTGSGNERILENFRRLCGAYPALPVTVRTPVIPGVNDTEEEIGAILDFLEDFPDAGYELLPYHAFGKSKYQALGRPYPMGDATLSEEKIKKLRQFAGERRKRKEGNIMTRDFGTAPSILPRTPPRSFSSRSCTPP